MGRNSFIGDILHTVAVRLRVNGSGNLRLFLRSLDDVYNSALKPQVMATLTNIEPTILANFNEQRTQLQIITIAINERFLISKIVVFVKPVASGYPIV